MSTGQLAHGQAGAPAHVQARSLARDLGAPGALSVALLALLVYAAFDQGAVSVAAQARISVALAVVGSLVAAGLWWTGTVRCSAPSLARGGIALLGLFVLWSGLTLLWSVDPDATWQEVNRVLAYLLVLLLGVVLGSSSRHALERLAPGFLVVALAVTIYALGQKMLPGWHVSGLFNLNQPAALPRLQEPLGYWNALALFIALAVPIGIVLAADRQRSERVRLAVLVSVVLMVLAIGLTLSRGGMLALLAGIAVTLGLMGASLRGVLWLAVAAVTALPGLVFGLTSSALTSTNVSLGRRESAGAVLLIVVFASLAVLIAFVRRLGARLDRLRLAPGQRRRRRRAAAGALAAVAVAALLAMAMSGRGLGGTVSHAWHSFTATHVSNVYNPNRLLSADSENRWVWWKEAAGAFSDRPLQGWGAGAFPVVHLLYRRDTLSVKQPHSVPLQWLAETGLIGALFAAGAVLLLLVVAVRAVRAHRRPGPRALGAALLGAVAAYFVHFLYDWDWDIPAVTLPVMLFLGVLVARPLGQPRLFTRTSVVRELPRPRRGTAAGLAALVVSVLCLCSFALSAVFPSLSATKASAAVSATAVGTPASVRSAGRSAELASRLDPLSEAGPLAQATIALREGQPRAARSALLRALDRNPMDAGTWTTLAYSEMLLAHDLPDARRAAARALGLDPMGASTEGVARTIAATITSQQTPPRASATAAPTH